MNLDGRLLCHCALPSVAGVDGESGLIVRTTVSMRNFPTENQRDGTDGHLSDCMTSPRRGVLWPALTGRASSTFDAEAEAGPQAW